MTQTPSTRPHFQHWGQDHISTWDLEGTDITSLCSQACNPSTLGGWGRWITRSRDRDHPGQHGETPSILKIQKISWAQWYVPIIPATQEAEAEELPEPRRRRLRWAEIPPLHSSLDNKSETPSPKKKNSIVFLWIVIGFSFILITVTPHCSMHHSN